MTAYTVMKTTLREEAQIPELAVQAFSHAFVQATSSAEKVVYVKDQQLIQQHNGKHVVLKDVSDAYVVPELKRNVLKRRKKIRVTA
ncbi:hypothetical protein [Acinetobacter sp. WZC-1]|uniref:hypothetical protein n=1 Tax=Acinetobacter sp. WZC-1 TaxID=3459034 RepID=UPI00403D9764